MGPIKLDKRIMDTMGSWGNNFDSDVGDNHNTMADKIDKEIDGIDVTLNVMSKMDASHPKTSAENPKVDMGFLAKAKPLMDTTGHGKLTRSLQD